jgi:alcohol dehydrogenase class IV
MRDFVFDARLPRVVFGAGALAHLPRELAALGIGRALVLSTPGQRALAERAAALLGGASAGVFAQAAMHVPVEVARAAAAEARRAGADGAVAIGGGSTTGLGKTLALDPGLPVVAVPTTYAGSEVTSVYGLTEAGTKKTARDPRVLPRAVIYDAELSLGLPWTTTVVSMLNAIAHAAEALYAPDANPVTDLLAEEGMRAGAAALDRLRLEPRDVDARGDALAAAWLCGTVLGNTTIGLHHKLCHTLGGSFGLPHAEVHAVVLPHALAYNAPAAPRAVATIARALAAARASGAAPSPEASAPAAVFKLGRRHGAPTSLAAIGMRAEDLDRAADLAMLQPYPNPRPLERDAIRVLLQRAFDGVAPD